MASSPPRALNFFHLKKLRCRKTPHIFPCFIENPRQKISATADADPWLHRGHGSPPAPVESHDFGETGGRPHLRGDPRTDATELVKIACHKGYTLTNLVALENPP